MSERCQGGQVLRRQSGVTTPVMGTLPTTVGPPPAAESLALALRFDGLPTDGCRGGRGRGGGEGGPSAPAGACLLTAPLLPESRAALGGKGDALGGERHPGGKPRPRVASRAARSAQ